MRAPRWSLRRARLLVGTKFLLVAGLVGFVVVAWLAELVAGLHHPVDLGPTLAALIAGIPRDPLAGFLLPDGSPRARAKQLVVGVCVLGTLIAAPLADFVQYQAVPPIALEVHGISPWSLDSDHLRRVHRRPRAGDVQVRRRSLHDLHVARVRRADGRHRLHDGVRHRVRGVGQLPSPVRTREPGAAVDGRCRGGRDDAGARIVRRRARATSWDARSSRDAARPCEGSC